MKNIKTKFTTLILVAIIALSLVISASAAPPLNPQASANLDQARNGPSDSPEDPIIWHMGI